jgi:hypothetical protein
MDRDMPEIRMNAAGLYRDELFTDRHVGTVHRLVPVMPDGTEDPARTVIFEGQTSVLTPAGSLPLVFEIQAGTLADAVDKFSGAAQEAWKHTVEELEELRRAAASALVVPAVGGPVTGRLGGAGGLHGSGRIRMP